MEFIAADGEILCVKRRLDPRKLRLTIDGARLNAGPVEALGRELVDNDFDPQLSMEFLEAVCTWGGGHRFRDRLLGGNAPAVVSATLREAYSAASADRSTEAVAHVQANIRYLGLSYASKIVRCLCPSHAVVLDSRVREGWGYTHNIDGHREFNDECARLLNLLAADPAFADIEPGLQI